MRLLLRLLLGALILYAAMAQCQSLDDLKNLWIEKKYEQVLPQLLAYRNQSGGRRWEVDYMIGTSECHMQGKEKKGEAVLGYVLENYHLPEQARDDTTNAIGYCQHRIGTVETPVLLVPISGQSGGAVVAGKGGFMFRDRKLTNTNVTVTPVSISDLQKRVFPADQSSEALKAATARIPGLYGAVTGNLAVLCENGEYGCSPTGVAGCLERYEQPLAKEFELQVPAPTITVYVVDLGEVPNTARALHGITLPLATVAYSVYEDLSIVGIQDGPGGCGSLAHELVHLSIRGNFGDAPPWLEEGLASEVAIGSPQSNTFEFGSSWRDRTLQELWKSRPTVAELLAANWSAYSATTEDEIPHVAAVHAMAAVFVRYLNARGKLVPVYVAMRDQRFPADGSVPRSEVDILQEKTGMTMAQIDADFVQWFQKSVPQQEQHSGPAVIYNPPRQGPAPPDSGNSPAQMPANLIDTSPSDVPNRAAPPPNVSNQSKSETKQ